MDGTSESPATSLHAKKPRRKHKNSKLGCVQCKERRMKCNEELPACRNCVIRQIKIPCSYLSFTEEQKKDFLKKKAENKGHDNHNHHHNNNSISSSPIIRTPSSISPQTSSNDTSSPIIETHDKTIKLVRHQFKPFLDSQSITFTGEFSLSVKQRTYFIAYINNQYLNIKHAFKSFFPLACLWLSIQLKHKQRVIFERYSASAEDEDNDDEIEELSRDIEILNELSIKYKSEAILYVRDMVLSIIKGLDIRELGAVYEKITLPSYILQNTDLLTKRTLKFYYTTGSSSVLKEYFEKSEEPSKFNYFIAKSLILTYNTLFMPNYSMEFLDGFLTTLEDFKPFIISTKDPALELSYNDLVGFIRNDILGVDWNSYYNKSSVVPYDPLKVYELQFNFLQLIPSKCFTIDRETSNIHKIFYSYYHALGKALDNIFPESRYISTSKFVGPTNIYPFYPLDIVPPDLDPNLKSFSIYSTRVAAFFIRRSDFFFKYMILNNPYPEELHNNRFSSRKAKVNEVYVKDFRTTILKPYHYLSPKSDENRMNFSSQGTVDYSSAFDTSFSFNLSMESTFSHLELNGIENDGVDNLNLYDVLESGLLTCDYDPLINDWPNDYANQQFSNDVVNTFLEDRAILINHFTK